MRSLFVMDPPERLSVGSDSTVALMVAATARGHVPWIAPIEGLRQRDGVVSVRCAPCPTTTSAPYFATGALEQRPLRDFDVVWMRKDPPVDAAFLAAVRLLAAADVPVANRPSGLLRIHEKLWASERFARFMPETLVTTHLADVRAFVAEVGRAVLKPLDGNGGRGILLTAPQDRNLPAMVELLTGEGRHPLIAQRFLPAVADGDKRVLLFDGRPAGAVLRRPGADDHRANLHVGGQPLPTELTARDIDICDALGPALRAQGQVFVGIDIIGDYLTEINVTSPTGLQEVRRWTGRDLASELLDVVDDWRRRAAVEDE